MPDRISRITRNNGRGWNPAPTDAVHFSAGHELNVVRQKTTNLSPCLVLLLAVIGVFVGYTASNNCLMLLTNPLICCIIVLLLAVMGDLLL